MFSRSIIYTCSTIKWLSLWGQHSNVHVRPRIYNTYLRDGHSQRDTYKYNVPYAPIGFSLMGKISYDDFGFFVRYTPTSVFEKDRGPQFKSITVGVEHSSSLHLQRNRRTCVERNWYGGFS